MRQCSAQNFQFKIGKTIEMIRDFRRGEDEKLLLEIVGKQQEFTFLCTIIFTWESKVHKIMKLAH